MSLNTPFGRLADAQLIGLESQLPTCTAAKGVHLPQVTFMLQARSFHRSSTRCSPMFM